MPKKSKAPYTVTQKDKDTAPRLVFYEIDQLCDMFCFCSCYRLFSGGEAVTVFREDRFVQATRNAFLEAFLVHARNLLVFFEKKANARSEDDILAVDLSFDPGPVDVSDDYRRRMNKSLSHLTYERSKYYNDILKKSWAFKKFLPLLDRCLRFVDHVLLNGMLGPDLSRENWEELRARLDSVLTCSSGP